MKVSGGYMGDLDAWTHGASVQNPSNPSKTSCGREEGGLGGRDGEGLGADRGLERGNIRRVGGWFVEFALWTSLRSPESTETGREERETGEDSMSGGRKKEENRCGNWVT